MKKHYRLKRRQNFLPTFLAALISWGLWIGFVINYPPESNFSLFTFYFLLFLAVFLTSALILANSKLGLTIASFTVSTLFFCHYEIANLLNLVLLTGIFIALGVYWVKY